MPDGFYPNNGSSSQQTPSFAPAGLPFQLPLICPVLSFLFFLFPPPPEKKNIFAVKMNPL
jgi:hypothetical protein